MSQFNGKGLKTIEGAQARINKLIGDTLATSFITNSLTFIAVQEGKYFPVVVLSEQDASNAFAIASHGVYVTR